jgi:hypothetical protein
MSFAGPTAEEQEELETGWRFKAPPPKRWAVVGFLCLVAFLLRFVLITEVIPALFRSP